MSSTDINPRAVAWRKSSYSVNHGSCIQATALVDGVAARDSAGDSAHIICFTGAAWQLFVDAVKDGNLTPLCGKN